GTGERVHFSVAEGAATGPRGHGGEQWRRASRGFAGGCAAHRGRPGMRNNAPILLVEDDEIDAATVERALRELHVVNPFARAEDGEEALAWLRDDARARPSIIL